MCCKPELCKNQRTCKKPLLADLQYKSRHTCRQVNSHFQNKYSVMGVMKYVSVGVVGEAARAAKGSGADRAAIGWPGGRVTILNWFLMF